MRIDDIRIARSAIVDTTGVQKYTLHVDACGYKFSGEFDNLLSFFMAVSDMMKFFGQGCGLLTRRRDGTYASTPKTGG